MNLEEAKTLLETCERQELRDHAFGDAEVYWLFGGEEIACGYFGGGTASVEIISETPPSSFSDHEARELRKCGKHAAFARNDTTGPEEYQEGATMPGLTLEGVRQELTNGDQS